MLVHPGAAMHPSSGSLSWLQGTEASGNAWSLEPAHRCHSLNGGKDLLSGRLAALDAVQLSASSDSALLDNGRRGRLRASSSGSESVFCPPRALLDATASSHLSAQLQQIHTWDGFDVFRVAELTQGRPLYTVAITIFEALGLLNWKLDRRKVEAFLAAAEAAYGRSNPYHNSTHAADVVQAAFIMLRSIARPQFTKLEVFGLLLAAIVHDIAHPGVTNDFLAKTGDARVAAHGAASPNEKHHLATAFAVASQDATNVFAGLSPAEEEQVRGFVRSAVLCTDMAQHASLSEQLTASRQRHTVRPSAESSSTAAAATAPAAAATTAPGVEACSAEDRALLLRAVLHAADLSNPSRPLPLGPTWGHLVAKEFLAQGDRERALGLPVTPACDRSTMVVANSQLKFIELFLRPLLEQMRGVLGEGLRLQMLERLAATESHWRRQQSPQQAA